VERDRQVEVFEGLERVFGNLKGFSRERDVDLVCAFSVALGVVSIAAEAVAIGQMFEDTHLGAALGAGKGWILLLPLGFVWDELIATVLEVLAPVLLLVRWWVDSVLPGVTVTFWASDMIVLNHTKLLSIWPKTGCNPAGVKMLSYGPYRKVLYNQPHFVAKERE
jgi:hypothetical protein